MHEDIPILNYLVPKEFTHENGKLTGVVLREGQGRIRRQGPAQPGAHRRARPARSLRRRAGRRRPGECVPLDRARYRHRVRQMGHAEGRHQDHGLDPPQSVLRRRRRLRPEEHHLGGRARPRSRASRSTACARGEDINERPAPAWSRSSARRWASTSGATTTRSRSTSATGSRTATRWWRCSDIKAEVELGYDVELALKEADRCLNCDVQTGLHRVSCASSAMPASTSARWTASPSPRTAKKPICARACRRRRTISPRTSMSPTSLKTGRVMVKDEDVCLHCGLCAERCPTGAWDMQKYLIDMTHAETYADATRSAA